MRLAPLLLIALAACTSMAPAPPAPTAVPAAAPAPASAPVATPPDSATPMGDSAEHPSLPANAEEAIDNTRRSVRSTAEWLARGVDSWFGDRPFEEGGKVTDGRMTLSVLKRQQEKANVDLRFNARFLLPNVERQTYLFFGREDQREVVSDKPGALSKQESILPQTAQDRSFFAGLGRYLGDSVDLRLGFRGVKPYAQARYRYHWELGERNLFEFRETLFWTLQDRFGSTTALSWERAFAPTLAARWVGSATITQELNRFAWSSLLGGYKSFGERRLLSLEGLINGEESSGHGPSDYGLQTRWEQPLFRNRLLGELILGRFWPRANALAQRQGVWAVGANLKLEF